MTTPALPHAGRGDQTARLLRGPATPDVEGIVPTFFVADGRRAVAWYVRVLGFRVAFLVEGPDETSAYCGLELGPARIHLAQLQMPAPGVRYKGACYLRLRRGVDAYVGRIEATGQKLTSPLKDHGYGMREATLRDPDGNDIYIGQPTQGQKSATRPSKKKPTPRVRVGKRVRRKRS